MHASLAVTERYGRLSEAEALVRFAGAVSKWLHGRRQTGGD